ncbi:hypothetical protein [Streptomyces gardneri]|uniref:hypothetical protein n=1 Tax=Streptomyces gardneri TaxID=66892 RepID=UPI0033E6E1E3
MRHMGRVAAAAAGTAVVAVLISGCGSGGEGASGAPVAVSETPTDDPTSWEELFPTEDPPPTEDPLPTEGEEPVDPDVTGPAAELDALVAQKGWEYDDDMYDSPSALVTRVCEELPTSEKDGRSPAQWLAEGTSFWDDGKQILLAGVPKLCPKWTDAVKAAASGKYDRWFGNGTYAVSSKPAEAQQVIPPGTYRSEGSTANCYWVRTTESGDPIDSQFATSPRKVMVTIRSSDGQFTSEGCAVWKPVK